MPRKKKTDTVDKSAVSSAFTDVALLLKDEVARTVSQLQTQGVFSEDETERVINALQNVTTDCVSRIRASRGF